MTALLPRLLALTVIWLLATSTFTFAAGNKPKAVSSAVVKRPAKPRVLEVPDVSGKAYVFAKGILQDEGFAWRVDGDVQGYAANTVAVQDPAPGTRVLDNGAPTVSVRLARNAQYGERGLPENASPYGGTRIVLASDWRQRQPSTEKESEPVEQPAPEAPERTDERGAAAEAKSREPDFVVPGAPAEPSDEMALPQRARRLAALLDHAAKPTDKLVRHFLYQHAWIVTGARFGWSGGAEALRILIRVDEKLQARWDIGARSEAVARRALAEVERKAK